MGAILSLFAVRIGTALVCGILLGMERERKEKPAGLRTILLITVGSALYMFVSALIPFAWPWPESITRSDPARIAAQVVSGIGFLGAGTIIQARGAIHGLTTAAVIWVAAGIGICAGAGYPITAIACTFVVLGALICMDPLRSWLTRRGPTRAITILAPADSLTRDRLRYTLEEHDVVTSDVRFEPDGEDLRIRVHHYARGDAAARLVTSLASIPGVRGVPSRDEKL